MAKEKATTKQKEQQPTQQVPPPAAPKTGLGMQIVWFAVLGGLAIILFLQSNVGKAKDYAPAKFDVKAFWNSDYQSKIENNILKRKLFVALNKYRNQFDFDFYGKVNLDENYLGKDDYVFAKAMTKASLGDDFIGLEAIQKEVKKALYVQSKLKEMGVELLIALAPGKSTVYKKYLPDAVLNTKWKTTNRETYAMEFKAAGVHHIDFVEYFIALNEVTPYPLFSQFGSHWSYYGECVAIDSTIKKLNDYLPDSLPELVFRSMAMGQPSVRDGDIMLKIPMNTPPKAKDMAYPNEMGYRPGVPQKIIGIGDSYFRGFFYIGAMSTAFANSQQWYYFNSIIPESPDNPEVWELDLMEELSKVKAVVIVNNESNLASLGNGFIDEAYLMFSEPARYAKEKAAKRVINSMKKDIRKDEIKLNELKKESLSRGISLDSCMNEYVAEKLK